MVYHVGLIAKGETAIFEYAHSLDQLNCEILEYYGTREPSSIAAVQKYARDHKVELLKTLNRDHHPRHKFTSIKIQAIPINDFTAGHQERAS